MPSNIGKRTLFILVVVLVSAYGVIGLPTSMRALRENMQERIPLGLDLKGGTHLILQVNVDDAINAEADQTIERLKQTLDQRQVTFADMTKIDTREITEDGGIRIEGVPPEQNSALRQAIDETELNWILTPESNAYRLTLRQPVLVD